MNKYFAYDPAGEGYTEFKTEIEARLAADEGIQHYLEEGWDEEVIRVVCGKITHRATQVDVVNRPPDCEIDEEGMDSTGTYWDADWSMRCSYKLTST